MIAHAVRADGFDASEGGTGRGTPIVPISFHGSQDPDASGGVTHPLGLNGGLETCIAFSAKDYGADADEISPTLRAGGHTKSHANAGVMPAIAIQEVGKRTGKSTTDIRVGLGIAKSGDPMFTLQSGAQHGVMTLAVRGRGDSSDLETRDDGTANAILTPNGGRAGIGVGAVAFHENQRAEVTTSDAAGSLKVGGGKPGQGYPAVHVQMQVRRLTPRECERLQGFPDDYTLIPVGKKMAADGSRYKALGNSMAVPVMFWIGERIQMVEEIS